MKKTISIKDLKEKIFVVKKRLHNLEEQGTNKEGESLVVFLEVWILFDMLEEITGVNQ